MVGNSNKSAFNVEANDLADFEMVFTMKDVQKAVAAAVAATKREAVKEVAKVKVDQIKKSDERDKYRQAQLAELAKSNNNLRLDVARLKGCVAQLEEQLDAEKADKKATQHEMAAITEELRIIQGDFVDGHM